MRFFVLALVALFFAPPAAAADLTVDAGSNYIIEARINGRPVRLRVDPETSGFVILNPDAVARLGLRGSWLRAEARIGPVRLRGETKVARLTVEGVTINRRMAWLPDRAAVEGADGLIGPSALPFDQVNFVMGPARAGEASFTLPMSYKRSVGLYFALTLGEEMIHLQFSLIKEESMATAAAGAVLAAAFGGRWTGEPRSKLIEYGVTRPVRPFALGRPAEANGLRFSAFLVRTGDDRGALDLPSEPDADPEEIVVNAASRHRALFALTLGLDRMRQCSAMIWNNRTRSLTLRCANLMPAA